MPRLNALPALLALAFSALAFARAPALGEETITLTVHHFLSPQAVTHKDMIVPWAKRIEEESGGRLTFEIFPSMTLGGKAPDLYGQVRDGVADIVWTLTGYTPGIFQRAEVFELPGVHRGNAKATNRAIQELMPEIAADFEGIKPLLIHVHGGNALHLVTENVRNIEDLRGLKIRSPSRTGAWMIESWGAEPVGMPVPTLPQALSRNTIDGGLIPFEVAVPLKIADITKHSVELYGGDRFGTSVFLFAMNKARFESLPGDLKAIIERNSGPEFADAMGDLWDGMEPAGKKVALDAGNTVTALGAEESAAFDKAHEAVIERWVESVSKNGIPGAELVETARARIGGHM